MSELDKELIKKALECCKTPLASDCENCSYTSKRLEDGVYEGCVNCLVGDALSLINELTEENERLSNRLLIADEDIKRLRNQVTATIILTEKDAEKIKTECLEKIELDVKSIKAETVQNLREAFALSFGTYTDKDFTKIRDVFMRFDKIAKEMLEGEK